MKQRKLYIQIIDNLSEKTVYCGNIITDKSCKECCELYASILHTVKVADETNATVCYMIGNKYMYAPLYNTAYVSYYKQLWRSVHTGMYDHARNAFYIEIGKLSMLLQRSYAIGNIEKEEERINQLVNDWEKRYYLKEDK